MLPQQVLDPRVRYHLRADLDTGGEVHGMVMFLGVRAFHEPDRLLYDELSRSYAVPSVPAWEIVLRGIGPLTGTPQAELDALPEISIIPETRGGETAT
ncbi:MAG TPA: hypothetical protein VM537_35865 [Anaerolineae bacterium]|nr:hypothetical protein [Anaerolineae bacterium]